MTGYLLSINGEASLARSGWFVMIRAGVKLVLAYDNRIPLFKNIP